MDRLHLKYNTATTLYFYIYNTNTYSGGEPVTGLGSSASCSYTIDGGSPTSTGTTVSELSSSYNPGVYKVVCTSAVTNGDVIIMSLFYSAGNRADPLTIYTDKTAGNLWKTNVIGLKHLIRLQERFKFRSILPRISRIPPPKLVVSYSSFGRKKSRQK